MDMTLYKSMRRVKISCDEMWYNGYVPIYLFKDMKDGHATAKPAWLLPIYSGFIKLTFIN